MADAMLRRAPGLVVALADVQPSDGPRVGTKAANLAALSRAGFPVPAGVVLTTDACDQPDDAWRPAVADAVSELGGGPLAVRSSALAEDLGEASFAGQYETVLDVRGEAAVARAVRRCWDSARAAHVRAYREAHGVDAAPMAVIIQQLVAADAAGVAFSADPVTGDRQRVVISAVLGLGDRLVSGEASPDEWVVAGERATCRAAPEQAIGPSDALAIATLARRVEAHFGSPQDIEWAIEGGAVQVLQARPITALPERVAPIPIAFEVPSGFWQLDVDHCPRPGHPIDMFVFPLIRRTSQRWSEAFGYLIDGIEFRALGLWAYMRMVPLGGREGGRMPPAWLMWALARTVPSLRRRIARAVEAARSDLAGRLIERWYADDQPELSRAIARQLEVDPTGLTDAALQRRVDDAMGLLERGIEVHSLLTGALAMVMFDLATTCRDLLGWDLGRAMDLVSGTSYKSTEPARQLYALARMAADRPAVRAALDVSDLDALGSVDEAFASALRRYLRDYGCRALGYNVGEPTLAETPALFLAMIRGQLERGYDPEADHRASADHRARSADEARRQLAERPADLARFERGLERAIRAYPVREDNEFFTLSAPLAVMRYAVLEVGRRLAERGVIDGRDDVCFLELGEARAALEAGGRLQERVAVRKGERAWAERNPGPPWYGEPPAGPPALGFLPAEARRPMEALLWSFEAMLGPIGSTGRPADGAIRGVSASGGRYTGRVCVVHGDAEFGKLHPGDVMVCRNTSPVWSVLFSTIGALVTDTGGVLSHPAIIAREYRIPAVVATGDATSRLEDGQVVTVDGAAGMVTRVANSS